MQDRPSGKSLHICRQYTRPPTKPRTLTVTLDHERLDNVMPDHLKVRMADPMADRSLGPSEKVIDHSDFVAQEHQTVDKVRPNETCPASNQNTLAIRSR